MITLSRSYSAVKESAKSFAIPSWISQFLTWCENQNENRLAWLAIALGVHGCFITPFTVMAILVSGAGFGFFMAALTAMAMSLVTNLAALPTRVTIPVFFFSIAMDLFLIIAAIAGNY